MNGLPDQPWHAEAIRLKADGVPLERICEAVDRSLNTVKRLLNPAVREGQRRIRLAAYHRWMQNPAFRRRQQERDRARRAAK